MSASFAPITVRALLGRVNLKLARLDSPRRVSCCRVGSRMYEDYGRYIVIDVCLNALVYGTNDLMSLASEHGVCRVNERLID